MPENLQESLLESLITGPKKRPGYKSTGFRTNTSYGYNDIGITNKQNYQPFNLNPSQSATEYRAMYRY